ncbi:MAG: cation:proton antiporter [Akkermansiaceae bacterium]|nr:cation:proton antiporter [Akkermansiaceae bacterium]
MILGGFFVAAGMANISPLFALLTLVLVLAVLVSLVLVKFQQSLLVGYLLSGVLIGNFGLLWMTGLSKGDPVIANLAEIGVVLLMFTLGIEFSFSELKHLWRTALVGGGLQVSITAGMVGLLAAALGFPAADSIVLGIAVALSSTAVAMMSFQDLGQQNNPGARASLGIALFQDILVIVFFLVMPALYGQGEGSVGGQIGLALLKGGLFLAGAWLLGRYGLTPLLHVVARTRSRELFTLTVIGLCAGVAFAGGALNLSLALGAFAAGLVVSESIYSHRILSDILPFKDLFLAIFFISVGLLIDLSAIAADWHRVLIGECDDSGIKKCDCLRRFKVDQSSRAASSTRCGKSRQHGRIFTGSHRESGWLSTFRCRGRTNVAGMHGGDDGDCSFADAWCWTIWEMVRKERFSQDSQDRPRKDGIHQSDQGDQRSRDYLWLRPGR